MGGQPLRFVHSLNLTPEAAQGLPMMEWKNGKTATDLIDGPSTENITASSETFTVFAEVWEALPISADHWHDRP